MPAKTPRRSKQKTTARRSAAKQSRAEDEIPADDGEEHRGYPLPLFPLVDPGDVQKIEVYRLVKRIKGRPPEPVKLPIQFPHNSDRDDLYDLCGGGHYVLRAKDHTKSYIANGTVSVILDGEPKSIGVAPDHTQPTANETSMGVITIPGVPPLVNLLFAQQQQLVAQARQDQADITDKIVKMFNSVCGANAAVAAAGGGSDREMLGLVLKLLLKDSADMRERLHSVATENTDLKEQRAKGKTKTSDKEVLLGVVDAVMQNGSTLVDAVGRAWRGELPAGEALKIAGGTVQSAANEIATEGAGEMAEAVAAAE